MSPDVILIVHLGTHVRKLQPLRALCICICRPDSNLATGCVAVVVFTVSGAVLTKYHVEYELPESRVLRCCRIYGSVEMPCAITLSSLLNFFWWGGGSKQELLKRYPCGAVRPYRVDPLCYGDPHFGTSSPDTFLCLSSVVVLVFVPVRSKSSERVCQCVWARCAPRRG